MGAKQLKNNLITRRQIAEQTGKNLNSIRTKLLYSLGIKPVRSEIINGKFTHLFDPKVVEQIKRGKNGSRGNGNDGK